MDRNNACVGQCRLDFVNSTTLKLSRKDGAYLPLKISGTWQAKLIPAVGVTLANTGLTANTLYYIYAFDNAGTLTLEASATAYESDADVGVMVKIGDATRTLVGMIQTGAGTPGVFISSITQRFVLSWFNRHALDVANGFTAVRTSVSAVYAEVHSEIRCEFLVWASEVVFVGANISVRHSDTHGFVSTAIAFDGATATVAAAQTQIYTGTGEGAYGLSLVQSGLAEGLHYATLAGATPSGTATWQGAAVGAVGAATARTSLVASVQG